MTAAAARNHGSYPAHQNQAGSKNTVKARLTANRPQRPVENDDYAAFARRILAAYARRVASGDVEALAQMTALAADLDVAIGQAVTGLREVGTRGPRSGCGSASPARPPSNAGDSHSRLWASSPACPPRARSASSPGCLTVTR